jgi:glutathione S-transferase
MQALTIARSIVNREIPSLKRESAERAIVRSARLLGDFDELLRASHSGWVLNTPHPTALDAHLIVFVARLRDAGRGELVPARVMEYADRAMNASAWKEVMQGRQTIPPGGF